MNRVMPILILMVTAVGAPAQGPSKIGRDLSKIAMNRCSSAQASSSYFLKMDGVEGESGDVCHLGEIELVSYQSSLGGGSGSANLSVSFSKKMDRASPHLFLYVASGKHAARAVLTIFAPGNPAKQLVYTLEDLLVTSDSVAVGQSTREDVILRPERFSMAVYDSTTAVTPTAPPPSAEVFLKIAGIPGDSQDPSHRGEIVVSSFTMGVSQPGGSGGGAGAGRAQFQDVILQKSIDSASPKLAAASAAGNHLAEAVLTVRPRGGTDLIVYRLKEVIIRSLSQSGSTERLTLNYASIELQYGTSPSKGWNLKTEIPIGGL